MGGGGKCLPVSSFPDTATNPESLTKASVKSSPTARRSYNSTAAGQSDDSKEESLPSSQSAFETERRSKIVTALMESYCSCRSALDDEKLAILRHKPGDWIEKVAGLAVENYDIPETTTLLLIGPQGSGKSSLVNRMTRVFEEKFSGIDRAQVSYTRVGEGTFFLQEYPIPRNSETLCIYDTRSLSLVPSENVNVLTKWMTEGVVHGDMDFQISDDAIKRNKMKVKAKNLHGYFCKKRAVNYVILVVNGVSILESMESKETQYIDMIVQTFNSPYVSFRDNKPAVVITHGDELSLHDRAFVRANLGELLGIPPCIQIFDIPDNTNHVTEAAIVDLLRFCIEHSDRNLPPKRTCWVQVKAIMSISWSGSRNPTRQFLGFHLSDQWLPILLKRVRGCFPLSILHFHLIRVLNLFEKSLQVYFGLSLDCFAVLGGYCFCSVCSCKFLCFLLAQKTCKKIWSIMKELDRFEVLVLFMSCFVSIYALVRIIGKWNKE